MIRIRARSGSNRNDKCGSSSVRAGEPSRMWPEKNEVPTWRLKISNSSGVGAAFLSADVRAFNCRKSESL